MTGSAAISDAFYHELASQLPPTLGSTLQKCQGLPSLPAVAMRVLEVASTAEATLTDYATTIEHDPALTARVLSVANSVHYLRASQPPLTCFEATQRLGTDATLATVLSFKLFEQHNGTPSQRLYWQRAFTAAVTASYFAQQHCPEQAGRVFTAALLQDIGMLALQKAFPADAEPLYGHEDVSHQQVTQAEQCLFGCDHALVGAWLLLKWGAHETLARSVYESHGPLDTDNLADLCIRLSGLVADAWLSPDPSQALALLIRQSNLMKLPEPLALDTLLTYLQQTLPPLSQSLGIPLALAVDSFSLIEQAQQRLFEHTLMLSTRLEAQQKSSEALLNDYTQLEQRSRIDPLTQLANRAWLEEQLRERFALCRAQQRTLSVVFIDLDHFKVLNDRYGHQAGDQVLAQFGSTLSALTRAGDLAGRYGGEEFLVLLPDETARTAEHFAERIAQRLQASPMVQVGHESLYISVSIGIACLDDGEFDNEREIIDAADQSMYTIKRAGRGGIAVYGRDLPSR
ncbi:diguanylate cyclase [Halomonas sp. NyZ770]|uniref:sensor domain-containing diguanylate cyclase n=1 Tax=Halomonas sp. NyZ770 TaxID=2883106 RepID=UPI001D09CC76|nr:diguanylate cyclase [Halomonas sp. NyZ770]UDM07005.1 diguanylate cyclase [Halomonas sp. NyZ770]